MKKPAPSILMRITSWTILLLMIGLVLGVGGIYLSSIFPAMPWWKAGLGATVVLAGVIAYLLGPEVIYKRFCEPLGYRCELKPEKKPPGAHDEVGLVISGKFQGHAFNLYSERDPESRTPPTRWTTLEWSGAALALPEFKLQVNQTASAGADSSASKLAARSVMSAPDPAAVRTLFTRDRWDALDPLIAWGSLEASPGLLVIRLFPQSSLGQQGRFPLPWDVESFLGQGEEIRRVLCPQKAA